MHWFSDSVTCPLALTVDMHVIIVVSRPPRWVPCQSPTYHPKKRNTTQETSAGPSSTPSCVRRPSPQGEARGLPPAASHTSRPLMPWLAVRGLVTARPRLDGVVAADPHGKEEGVKQQKGLPLPNRLVLYLQLRNNVDPSIRHDQSRETPPASVDPLPEPQTLVQIQFHTPLREHHFTPETGRGRHSAPDPHPGARRGQMTRSACIRVRPGLTGLTYPMRRSHLDQFLQKSARLPNGKALLNKDSV